MATSKRGRNWTKEENELYTKVLVDPNENFVSTLEKKALKNSANAEVFEHIMKCFNTALTGEGFVTKMEAASFTKRGVVQAYEKLEFSGKEGVQKLKNKYKELKGKWRKVTDSAKRGSGEEGAIDERWYQLLNPIMSETNGDLDDIVNSARDTSFVISREIYSENEDDIYVDPYVNDDIYLSDLSGETIPLEQASNKKKRLPNEPVPPAKKGKLVVKPPHKKGQVIRSQTQGLGMLASSIK